MRFNWATSAAGIILIGVLLLGHAWDPPPVEVLRLRVFDQYLQLAPRETLQPSPVVIVDVDEESLQQLGQWPWPRTVFARLIERLGKMGAAVIAFDVIFSEPDRLSPPALATVFADLNPRLAQALEVLPDNDSAMAEAMRQNRVILGQPASARPLKNGAAGPLPTASIAEINGDPRPYLMAFADTVRSLAPFESAARGIGLVTLTPESDGVVRRVAAVADVGGRIVPALAIEILRVAAGQSTIAVRSGNAGVREVVLQGVAIPTDREGRVWVHYSRRNPDLYVSAADVLSGRVDSGRIANRLVIVGGSAAGLGDIKATPVSGNMAGVEVHAQLLETILTHDHLYRSASVIGMERGSLLLAGLLLALVGPRLAAGWMPPVLVLTTSAFMAVSWFGFHWYNLMFDGVYPTFAIATLVLWLTLAKYIREEQSRRAIRSAFNQYLSPVMIDRLVAHPEQLNLSGENRELTIMFSDIRGFTTLSEQLGGAPEHLTELINRYFTAMTAEVMARDGTIDKYIGDAMMAFWNAPLDCPGHRRQACLAALGMTQCVEILNAEIAAEHAAAELPFTPIAIGVGLNSGECHVGNLGSEQRFNYSAMGDPVNVASRIEGQTKLYGVKVVIGESTQAGAAELATLRLDLIRLKGKRLPVWLYGLLGDDVLAGTPEFTALRERHDQMLSTYRAQDWDAAESCIAGCREAGAQFGLDVLYDVYLRRIAQARAEPPDP
jgi:adenylate cyclase